MSNLFSNVIKRLVPLHGQQIRNLPRWSHRTSVRVIPAEEYDKARDTQIRKPKPAVKAVEEDKNVKINWNQSRTRSLKLDNVNVSDKSSRYKIKTDVKPLSISKTVKRKEGVTDMLETIIDAEGNFVYAKMKDNDSRISSILVEVKSKKEKEKKDLILLEGKRLIKDALDAGCQLKYILFSRIQELEYLKPSLPKIGAKLYKMPYREMQLWSDLTTTPGIMGIFKIPDTEAYKPPPDSIPLTVICDNVREPNNLGAILRTCSGVGCENIILTKGCVNVWDTKVVRSASGAHFKLHISRKLSWSDIKERLPSESSIYIADNKTVNTVSNDNSSIQNLQEKLESVPLLPYYGVQFGAVQHVVLIIGGETDGVSEQSYELASELKGVRLNIPLSNKVESLNSGTALGIIAFEIKRQLLKNQDIQQDYLSSKC